MNKAVRCIACEENTQYNQDFFFMCVWTLEISQSLYHMHKKSTDPQKITILSRYLILKLTGFNTRKVDENGL